MPEVVLRHPDLPGQPLIVDVPVGSYVPLSYKEAGWSIDSNTTADEAGEELAALAEKAAQKQAEAEQSFVPQFEPDPAAPEQPQASPKSNRPAQPAASDPAPAEPVNPEGN